jgi:hypothetical protein
MKAIFAVVALLALGYGADVYYFTGIHVHAASLMLAEIARHFH